VARRQVHPLSFGVLLSAGMLLALPLPAHAQVILSIDTLTSGRSENSNPVVPHDLGAMYGEAPFVIFERREDGQSQIALLPYDFSRGLWSDTPRVISATDDSRPQRRPDCSQFTYNRPDTSGRWVPATASAIAWERFEQGRWNIWYALQADRSEPWTEPRQLTDDALGNTSTQVRALPEKERFLTLWKADTALVGIEIAPDGSLSAPETLAVSNFAEFSYHTHTTEYFVDPGPYDFVWTVRTSSGSLRAVYRYRQTTWSGGGLSEPDTLPALDGLCRATIASAYGSGYVFLEQQNAWPPGGDIYLFPTASGWGPENITNAPEVSNSNPSSYTSLIITKSGPVASGGASHWISVLAFERTNRHSDPPDSGIVVHWYSLQDTIRSPGYNRRPCIGAIPFYHSTLKRYVVPLVWESNRTGRAQVYGAFLGIFLDAVESDAPLPAEIVLRANYPNPFNPTTTIEYVLPHATDVSLTVLNILGEEVATLAGGERTAGLHSVQWEASGNPAGVYFCRLKAGKSVATMKMLLLR
jgi:hypothetical protein